MKISTDLTENQITDLKNRIMGKVRRTIGYNEAEDKTAYESAAKTILFHGFVEAMFERREARGSGSGSTVHTVSA